MDEKAIAMLSVEAVGTIGLQAIAKSRRKPGPCLEHLQIGPWALGDQPQSRPGLRIVCTLFCKFRITQIVRKANLINRTAVVRDPYARWCGREGP